jgi:RNA polymerase sigma factor (TIGR02999 family)
LQPTALVHEAYLRIVKKEQGDWQTRARFLGLAAQVMRDVLIDHQRRHCAAKRDGGYRLSLSQADHFNREPEVDLLALDEALKDLSKIKPQHSRVVELRFFGGLTIEETAEVLGISHATVERDWNFARAWLRSELKR